MTGTKRSSEGLDARRRKLLFRSWHSGTREMDLIMGRFADAHITGFSDAELDKYERLVESPDPDLLAWITGMRAPPPGEDTTMFRRLCEFQMRSDK